MVIDNCRKILSAYKQGKLGQTVMPEDTNPGFTESQIEERLAYFTLPMSLNYQRDSYKLWEAALKTYNDTNTNWIFDVGQVASKTSEELRGALMKYKIALQPNKHIQTWQKISKTVFQNWKNIRGLLIAADYDFLKLKDLVQTKYKSGFPYLSGPKIFNYWSFILTKYCNVKFKNSEYIDIAPDTHITKCSVKLGLITQEEAEKLSKEEISLKWRDLLKETDINPIDMHAPLWFWSRNSFLFKL